VPQNLSELEGNPRYQFVKGDVADKRLVQRLLDGVELVVHFAAETHVDRSITDPESFLHSNVNGTFTILEAVRKFDVKKFIHVSTDEVYGSAKDDVSFCEDDELHPSSPYSASKAASEMYVQAYNKTYGLRTVTLRCTNNFGPRQFPEKFIPKMIIATLLGRKVPIYGSGMQVRDWIYVNDFCNAIEHVIEKGEVGAIYNVSAGNELPNLEIAKQVLKYLGKPADMLEFVEDRPGHDFRYSLDSTRIRKLGWSPEHNLRDALKMTVEWYVKNEAWWRPILTEKTLSKSPWNEGESVSRH
jgi:dTDP-glucose 4,6-dehydratase